MAVDTPQEQLWMELDSGSDGPLIVGRHAAAVLGLDPARKEAQSTTISLVGGVPIKATNAAVIRGINSFQLAFDASAGGLSIWCGRTNAARGHCPRNIWTSIRRRNDRPTVMHFWACRYQTASVIRSRWL